MSIKEPAFSGRVAFSRHELGWRYDGLSGLALFRTFYGTSLLLVATNAEECSEAEERRILIEHSRSCFAEGTEQGRTERRSRHQVESAAGPE